MLRWFPRLLLGAASAVALAFGPTGAASASVLPFTGTFGVSIDGLGPVPLTGSGTALVNGTPGGHLSSFALPGGVFSGQVPFPVTDPAAVPVSGLFLSVVANHSGVFTGFSGATPGGTMGFDGTAQICLFSFFGTIPCPVLGVIVPLSQSGTRGLGIGGGTIAFFNTLAHVGATVQGFPWAASGTFGTPNSPVLAFVHGPASLGGSSAARNSGVVQLVSPLLINTNIPASSFLPGYGILTLHFVPEPGTLLLLGTGVASLALSGRKRMRGRKGSPALDGPLTH